MTKIDINKKPFHKATMLKLDIFRRCFREWFPVFVHHPNIKKIYIYDMFAGSGTDSLGNPGSPIILLEEARGDKCQHCKAIVKNNKCVVFGFNEKEKEKELGTFGYSVRKKKKRKNCLIKLKMIFY